MRPIKKTKPKSPGILEQQSDKLKQKLQLLKQQVTLRKHEKQMSRTATSLKGNKKEQRKQLATIKCNTQYPVVDVRLSNALVQMKIQNMQQKLKEKGIKSYERLLSLSEQEIDQWKDLLVGYRIKIKRYIKNCANLPQNSSKNTNCKGNQPLITQKQQIPAQKGSQIEEKNIEDIIKEREKDKMFVAIDRQVEQEEADDCRNYEITDEDEDIMIQSFINVFQPRRGILKIQKSLSINKLKKRTIVHWSRQVQKMQKQFKQKNHKKYPKQAIPKQVLINLQHGDMPSQNNIPQNDRTGQLLKFCWKCFRKIDVKYNIGFKITGGKQFCSQKCYNLYSDEIDHFQSKIENLHVDQSEEYNINGRQQNDGQGIEIIDLSIL